MKKIALSHYSDASQPWWPEGTVVEVDGSSGQDDWITLVVAFCSFFRAAEPRGLNSIVKSVGSKVAALDVRIKRSDIEILGFIHLSQ